MKKFLLIGQAVKPQGVRGEIKVLPATDDVAFGELDRFAVRVRDNQIQLFGLLLEGWQSLAEGRPVNAKFRAVQVLKLAD